MSLFTDLAGGYAQQAKERNKDARGVSEWEKYFLQPTQAEYESGVREIQSTANYDISKAFANYKQQQLSLAQAKNIGSGFSKKLSEGLSTQLNSSIAQSQSSALASLQQLNSKYQSAISENEKTMSGYGKLASDITAAAAEYLGYSDEQLLGALGANIGNKKDPVYGAGWYSLDEEGYRNLTARGQEELMRVVLSEDFANRLREENPELYEQYAQNPEMINELVTGTKETTYDPLSDESIARRLETIHSTAWNAGDKKYGKWGSAFGDAFDAYNSGKMTEDDLATLVIKTFEADYGKSTNEYFKKDIKKWANNITKGKSKTINKNDAEALSKLIDTYGNFGKG